METKCKSSSVVLFQDKRLFKEMKAPSQNLAPRPSGQLLKIVPEDRVMDSVFYLVQSSAIPSLGHGT